MATVGERLASLEEYARGNRAKINELHDDIHGGATVAWNQSIRGRLHAMMSAIEAADKLADAARELARIQEANRRSRLSRLQWAFLALCALLTAVAPYVIVLTH